MKSSSKSPRSSPLLQFFTSKDKPNNNTNNNNSSTPITPSPSNNIDTQSTSSSVSIIRTLSKCFDGGVGQTESDAILNDDELEIVNKAKSINVNTISKKENKNGSGRKSPSITTFNNIFKQSSTTANNQEGVEIVEPTQQQQQPSSPSKGSQCQSTNNSNSTNPTNKTEPLTTSTTNKDTQLEHSRKTGMLMKDGCFIHEPTTSSSAVLGSTATPLTPCGQSSQILQNHSSTVGASTPNTTTTALGVSGSMAVGESGRTTAGMTNFWNNHTQPHATLSPSNGDGSQQSNAASSYIKQTSTTKKPPSSLSMAAADAVLGLITKAEAFLVSTTGVSPSNGTGLCGSSPTATSTMERPSSTGQRSSSAPANLNQNDLAGIPEGDDEHTTNSDKLGFCGNLNTGVGGCFEFEDFGFNAFQDNSDRYYDTKVINNKNNKSQQQDDGGIKEDKRPSDGPPQPITTSPSELNQPKGYEIRLKSSFSQLKAKEDKDKYSNPPSAFGRTHPNNTNTNYKKSKSQPNITTKETHEDYGSSRALPDGLPFRELSVPSEIEHSVSELTMRSHGAFERHKYTSDSRRMAYYAVGRTTSMNNDESGSRKSSSGGNRRCYFTGHSILYGMPFYAGSVQQGPRTLVVFCLPSALGLGGRGITKGNTTTRPIAKFSSKAERDRYLESLPDPDQKLLQEMSKRYPEPFDTLPVQVRSPHCWRLFVKFCFFSGLPIAEGEMHYRVKSTIRVMASSSHQQQQQEEIALSHEVMEAVNGEVSAELLRLPNQKVFDYLKRQYSQQSSKLTSEVFGRNSWEVVMAEV